MPPTGTDRRALATPPRTERGRRRVPSPSQRSVGAEAPGLDTLVVYDPISAGSGMRDYLAAHPAGLVAVTSRLRDRLPHLVFGSGAADIVHASTAPALVIPAGRRSRHGPRAS